MSLTGDLDVCSGASAPNDRAYATHNGKTSYLEVKTVNRDTSRLICFTDFSYGSLHPGININDSMRLTYLTNELFLFKLLANSSGDRLKGNGKLYKIHAIH